jgi:DNA-binding PadR family transcriptional regulator
VLDLALLGLLKERPMHGYDLRKRLQQDFDVLANLSFGSLYPALARLESAGAVRPQPAAEDTPAVPFPAVPSTGSLSGERAAYRARQSALRLADRATRAARGARGRKVYEITRRGEELFTQLLDDDGSQTEDARAFALKFAFARHLTPDARLRLLERRRARLNERLGLARRPLTSSSRPLDPYRRALAEHAVETIEHDISWLDRLIDAEHGVTGGSARGNGRTA